MWARLSLGFSMPREERRATQGQYDELGRSLQKSGESSETADLKQFQTDERQIAFIKVTLEKNESIANDTVLRF